MPLSVSNAPVFGGVLGMRVPGASMTDGLLDDEVGGTPPATFRVLPNAIKVVMPAPVMVTRGGRRP